VKAIGIIVQILSSFLYIFLNLKTARQVTDSDGFIPAALGVDKPPTSMKRNNSFLPYTLCSQSSVIGNPDDVMKITALYSHARLLADAYSACVGSISSGSPIIPKVIACPHWGL